MVVEGKARKGKKGKDEGEEGRRKIVTGEDRERGKETAERNRRKIIRRRQITQDLLYKPIMEDDSCLIKTFFIKFMPKSDQSCKMQMRN